MISKKSILFLLLVCTFIISCSQSDTEEMKLVTSQSRQLMFPSAYYEYVVYVNNRLVAFSVDPNKPPSKRISFAYEGGTELHLFTPMPDPSCEEKASYNVMGGVLPDGRLGILRDCFAQAPFVTRSIYAYDWEKHILEQIVKGPIAPGLLPKAFTWNPQMTMGVQEMGNGIEGTIYWISPRGASPIDVEIEDKELKWNLRDYFEGKKGVGSASAPAWSPDGVRIAFLASSYGIREEPLPKMNIKHELYLMNYSDMKPVIILSQVSNAFRLRWSPDSKRLLFSGCMGSRLQCGLWLYDVKAKSVTMIDKGGFQDFTWVENDKVVAIKNITLPYDDNQIWEYSLLQ